MATEVALAATVLLVRDGDRGLEVLTVVRSGASPFMAGNLVFPGGKLDASDADVAWEARTTPLAPVSDADFGHSPGLRAFAVAACREGLREAAVLPVAGGSLDDDALVAMRVRLAAGERLDDLLAARGLLLDAGALRPFARWITPLQEGRRYDTRFFLARAPSGQTSLADATETTTAAFRSAAEVLEAFETGTVRLAPPTHKCLTILAAHDTVDALLAAPCCLEPILPVLVPTNDGAEATVALVLPGDPEHPVGTARAPGPTRYVLRAGRMTPVTA